VTVSSTDIEQGQVNFLLEGATESKATGTKNNSSYARGKGDHKKRDHDNDRSHKKDKKFPSYKKEKPRERDRHATSEKPVVSKKLQAIQKFESKYKEPERDSHNETAKPRSGPQEIKPRYSSLSDYLDQMAKKGNAKDDKHSSHAKSGQRKEKSDYQHTSNREDSKKRHSSSNDSGGVRKARPSKSGRKNKSR
jgi:hypothetical protein